MEKVRKIYKFFTVLGYLLQWVYLMLAFIGLLVSCFNESFMQLYELMLFIAIAAFVSFALKLSFEIIAEESLRKIFSSIFFISLCFYNILSNLLKIMF